MLKPLSANRRRALLRIGLHACAIAAVLTPLVRPVRFEANAASRPAIGTLSAPAVPAQLQYPGFTVTRDPFVAAVAPEPGNPLAADLTPVLPPNDAIAGTPVVRAIVTGASPRALIDQGGRAQMVGVGDAIAGATVTAIDSRGVVLDDGETLPFPERRP